MNLANMQGKLTRAEMKNILAGAEDGGTNISFGACTGGSIGEWEYNPPVSSATCHDDINLYCASGYGTCGGSD